MGESKRKRCMKKCRSGTRTSGKGWKRYGIAYSLMKDRAEKAEAQIEAAETRAADAEARAKAAELAASLAGWAGRRGRGDSHRNATETRQKRWPPHRNP